MSSTPGTSAAADSALQVLAATASDNNLCERLATAPNGGPKGAAAPSKAKGKKKKSRDAGEEDASAIGSISDSFSKQTGLRKGKWTVSCLCMFPLFPSPLPVLAHTPSPLSGLRHADEFEPRLSGASIAT